MGVGERSHDEDRGCDSELKSVGGGGHAFAVEGRSEVMGLLISTVSSSTFLLERFGI